MRGPAWPQALGFPWEGEEVEVECERCGARLSCPLGDDDRWAAIHKEARRHWEAHAGGEYPVEFFELPGLGDRKHGKTGTWADVVATAQPYLTSSGGPVPSLIVVRELLQRGRADAGMSGGCEWPRHALTDAEYGVLRAELVGRGCVES